MLKILSFAFLTLWRDVKSGYWYLIFLALCISITAVSSLEFYIHSVMAGVEHQGALLLGGDIAISSSTPIPPQWKNQAKLMKLSISEVWIFPTVLSANQQVKLINLQAVDEHYPLLGNQRINLASHETWVDKRLFDDFIHLNDNVNIGYTQFRVKHLLPPNFPITNLGWLIAPPVLIPLKDIAATKLVQAGSRIEYRLLVAGEEHHLSQYQVWLAKQLTPQQRVITVREQQLVFTNILNNAEQLLQLLLLTCLAMSAIALVLSTQYFLRQQYTKVALWRCLGLTTGNIRWFYIIQFISVALFAAFFGLFLGYLCQQFLSPWLDVLFSQRALAWNDATIIKSILLSMILLFIFGYTVITQLPQTSAVFLWRQVTEVNPHTSDFKFILGLVSFAIFLYVILGFHLITLFFIHTLLICIAVLFAMFFLWIKLIQKCLPYTTGYWHRGLHQIVQHTHIAILQLIGFSLILTLFLVINFFKNNAISSWQASIPPYSPNVFIFNISALELNDFKAFIDAHHIIINKMYPMVRGRLIELNGQNILAVVPANAIKHNALHRELNLSWMRRFPADNRIVSGKTWLPSALSKASISVEAELAHALNLNIGDKLTFLVGDKKITAPILNIRSVKWTSFHPNFYVIFSPGSLNDFAATYLASFYLPVEKSLLAEVSQRFPNVTIIDVDRLLHQMQTLLANIVIVVEYLFYFIMGAGSIFLIGSMMATKDERRKSQVLLKLLGASNRFMIMSIVIEFTVILSMAGLFAVGMSQFLFYLLSAYFFNL